jgi:hypothetical protein
MILKAATRGALSTNKTGAVGNGCVKVRSQRLTASHSNVAIVNSSEFFVKRRQAFNADRAGHGAGDECGRGG